MPSLREWMRRLSGAVTRRRADRDLAEELASHLELAEADLRGAGHGAREAARLARIRFGGPGPAMDDLRSQRGLPGVDAWWLDVKLGLRMLRKSWGLTLVGGLGMTVAISIGVVVFAISDLLLESTLPLDEGDRVVAIQVWDATAQRRLPTRIADFERWRASLRRVVDVGAFVTRERNLIQGDGAAAEPVEVAEITASAFELARVAPRLGRPLIEADERAGAAPVVVIGHDVWQSRFDADPAIVGKTLRLGATVFTIVGVMPAGFAFPVDHDLWIPLRERGSDGSDELSAPPTGSVFARLAPGASLEEARIELEAIGLAESTASSERELARGGDSAAGHRIRPRIVPYTFGFTGDFEGTQVRWVVRVVLLLITLLLVPPCGNVAILVYARAVMRHQELATRYALGASRTRVVGQLFVELLVLAGAAACVALLATSALLRFFESWQQENVPFWIDFGLTAETVAFAAVLAVLAAAIAGLVPALQATRRLSGSALLGASSRGSVGLGGVWTVLVVGQVALSLAILPSAVELAWGTLRSGVLGPGFAAEQVASARLELDEETAPGLDRGAGATTRFGAIRDELARRLQGEPGITDVAWSANVPGEEPWVHVEIEGLEIAEQGILAGRELVRVNRVGDGFFELFGSTPLTGRLFGPADRRPDASAVIVDRTFVEQLVGSANPLGRRLRYRRAPDALGVETAESAGIPARWFEIVGVIDDLPANEPSGKVFHPAEVDGVPDESTPATLLLRLGEGTAAPSDRLREIAVAIDPTLRVEDIRALDVIYRDQAIGNNLGAFALAITTSSVLLLSAAGIYALMSFTVDRRRREIGIRAALGARPGRLLAAIYRRALYQLGTGAACGMLTALLVRRTLPIVEAGGWEIPGVIPAATLLMIAIGLLAAVGPSRRGLTIEPLDELRES